MYPSVVMYGIYLEMLIQVVVYYYLKGENL